MATRAIVRFATREPGVSFSEHPDKWHAQFYVHRDGNVESLGLDIANSIANRCFIPHNLEIDDLSCKRSDVYYCYYVWQHFDKSTWISIFRVNQSVECEHCDNYKDIPDECIFVGEPMDLQNKINSLGAYQAFDAKSRAFDGNWNGEKITCL